MVGREQRPDHTGPASHVRGLFGLAEGVGRDSLVEDPGATAGPLAPPAPRLAPGAAGAGFPGLSSGGAGAAARCPGPCAPPWLDAWRPDAMAEALSRPCGSAPPRPDVAPAAAAPLCPRRRRRGSRASPPSGPHGGVQDVCSPRCCSEEWTQEPPRALTQADPGTRDPWVQRRAGPNAPHRPPGF